MKKLKIFSFIFILTLFSEQLSWAGSILGIWLTKDKDSHVEIYKQGELYFGKVIWIIEKDKNKLDTNNPDPKLRETPLLNLVFLKDFKGDEEGKKFTGGKVYDPKNGKTYTSRLYYHDDDTLELRGFVGIPLFGRSETWTRLPKD